MNTNNHRELLDEVLDGDSAGSPPTASRILALIRHEKAARQRRRCLAAVTAAAVLILAALPLVRDTGTSPEPPVPAVVSKTSPEIAPEIEPQGFKIARIGDEELMDLLDEQPSALVRFPDGERQLLLVVWQSFSEGDLEAMNADAAWNQP